MQTAGRDSRMILHGVRRNADMVLSLLEHLIVHKISINRYLLGVQVGANTCMMYVRI